jgi:hypothetical protein
MKTFNQIQLIVDLPFNLKVLQPNTRKLFLLGTLKEKLLGQKSAHSGK